MTVTILLSALAAAYSAAPQSSAALNGTFISPMGEPFTAASAGGDALATWFSKADGNHDGSLSAAEMQADAARFFALLDLNHDGEIDPDEMTNYEIIIAPQVHTGAAPLVGDSQDDHVWSGAKNADGSTGPIEGSSSGGDMRSADQGGSGPKARLVGPEGAGRFGLLNIPQPVAAADTNFNRGVSAEEFGTAAAQRFQLLDTNHDGRLTLPELEALRR
jgi:EF hand domain-containing protein